VQLDGLADDGRALVAAWQEIARQLQTALGWGDEELIVIRHPQGAQCFTSAPVDALLAATELNEAAWSAAEAAIAVGVSPDLSDLAARLRVHVQHEARPHLVALQQAAHAHAVNFSVDDDQVILGGGVGARVLPLACLPDPTTIAWSEIHDVPVALVTGSNGKTTTARLLAAICTAAGMTAGLTSTDGVTVGGEDVSHGDWSGPAGARLVLRDRRVTTAVLETARGGMLRRGLALTRATVAVVTNVTADHLGEYGVHDLQALTRAKLVVVRVVVPGGRVVLNADDHDLVSLAPTIAQPLTWFSLDASSVVVQDHIANGGDALFVHEGRCVAHVGGAGRALGHVREMPLTFGGAARHNVANVLAAAGAALALGVEVETIRRTLLRFGASSADNPGRLVRLQYNGAQVIVDFAHNPDGWRALVDAAGALPARRRIVLVGQAGDRDDAALEALAEAVREGRPDVVIVKEMSAYLRGRAPGEVSQRLGQLLIARGLGPDALRLASSEEEGIGSALDESGPGDLLLLGVHQDYSAAIRYLLQRGAVWAS